MSLAPRRSKSGETSLTSLLDLVTGRQNWLGGLARRTDGKEPRRRKSRISVVWQDFFALEEEQGVVHDIDITVSYSTYLVL